MKRFPAFPSLPGMVDNFFRDDDPLMDLWSSRRNWGVTVPAVNVLETNDAFQLEVAAPGLKRNDFELKVENGMLWISAKNKAEKEVKEEGYTRKEFSFQSFERSFWLPENIVSNKIEANYVDGILKIMLPKVKVSEPAKPKRIEVS